MGTQQLLGGPVLQRPFDKTQKNSSLLIIGIVEMVVLSHRANKAHQCTMAIEKVQAMRNCSCKAMVANNKIV